MRFATGFWLCLARFEGAAPPSADSVPGGDETSSALSKVTAEDMATAVARPVKQRENVDGFIGFIGLALLIEALLKENRLSGAGFMGGRSLGVVDEFSWVLVTDEIGHRLRTLIPSRFHVSEKPQAP